MGPLRVITISQLYLLINLELGIDKRLTDSCPRSRVLMKVIPFNVSLRKMTGPWVVDSTCPMKKQFKERFKCTFRYKQDIVCHLSAAIQLWSTKYYSANNNNINGKILNSSFILNVNKTKQKPASIMLYKSAT